LVDIIQSKRNPHGRLDASYIEQLAMAFMFGLLYMISISYNTAVHGECLYSLESCAVATVGPEARQCPHVCMPAPIGRLAADCDVFASDFDGCLCPMASPLSI